ncbi:hypothetical protein [Gilvimarinus algae]|uniref:Uncharacterized protein n=1 Tax=Gilvimarinus algae TaxID=3058037 RepID=A0ABT8TL66_9GAMM|nr:hypothetical protein [Gilvimarinus sp. SDUM040014]MDO3383848.1 hypothetical protein [Gilvimarinus sp. SDUM040014]
MSVLLYVGARLFEFSQGDDEGSGTYTKGSDITGIVYSGETGAIIDDVNGGYAAIIGRGREAPALCGSESAEYPRLAIVQKKNASLFHSVTFGRFSFGLAFQPRYATMKLGLPN